MEDSKKIRRRRHSAELKAQVLSECARPGVSISSVAMSHVINANLVHKWRRLADTDTDTSPATLPTASFVPLALAAPSGPAAADIRMELHRGATSMTITWPCAAAADCAVWMRELLR